MSLATPRILINSKQVECGSDSEFPLIRDKHSTPILRSSPGSLTDSSPSPYYHLVLAVPLLTEHSNTRLSRPSVYSLLSVADAGYALVTSSEDPSARKIRSRESKGRFLSVGSANVWAKSCVLRSLTRHEKPAESTTRESVGVCERKSDLAPVSCLPTEGEPNSRANTRWHILLCE